MADVFISYASADIVHTRRLEDLLVNAGYSVWWDRHLLSGQSYQDSIKRELAQADAVLVMWTPTSVQSDWVYSEARRGNERRALVQVRARGVTVNDLPAPFDAFHCPYVDDDEAVLRAVAALAAPTGIGSSAAGLPVVAAARTLTLLFVDLESGSGDVPIDEAFEATVAGLGGEGFAVDGRAMAAAFASATQAVTAAVAFQLAMRGGTPARPGVGVHTGTPTRFGEGYIGMDVLRGARIAAAANPGQILVSAATAALIDDAADLCIRDLGTHTFRDLPRPEHLHQVGGQDLEADFPPISSLGSPTGLPTQATAFLGRADDLAELDEALAGDGTRLVTLIGPGGIGKTRLALAAAERSASRFSDGIYFVPLETVTAADAMWAGIGTALGLPTEQLTRLDVLQEVGSRPLLLVLDNLEQVPDADGVVEQLLAACPELHVLATSRGPLHVAGEQEHAVRPLLDADSVALFVRQARLVRRGFELDDSNRDDVIAICHALDGLPLAIELAAARTRMLSPKALLQRLDAALDVASSERSRPDRQRTLRKTIEWSYNLLGEEHQALFRLLGVFSGGAGMEAVESVAAQVISTNLDVLVGLDALSEAALISIVDDPAGEPRVHLLNMTKAFARDQLAQRHELSSTMEALISWCHEFAASDVESSLTPRQPHRRSHFALEMDNLRVCLQWIVDGEHAQTLSDELVLKSLRLARPYGLLAPADAASEARRWIERLLSLAPEQPSVSRGGALSTLAIMRGHSGDHPGAYDAAMQAVEAVQVSPQAERDSVMGRAILGAAVRTLAREKAGKGELDEALKELVDWLDVSPDAEDRARSMTLMGAVQSALGDPEGALATETEAARLARSVGSLLPALELELNSACSLRELGKVAEARELMEKTIPILLAEGPDAVHLPTVAEDYAAVLVASGEHESAAILWGAAAAFRHAYGFQPDQLQVAETAELLAECKASLGPRWDVLFEQGLTRELEECLLETVASAPHRGVHNADAP